MIFSQFPPPTTSGLENGAHSRPSRLRRFSNLRNYRSAVAGAVSTGTSNLSRGSSSGANSGTNTGTNNAGTSTSTRNSSSAAASPSSPQSRIPPDLLLTRSMSNSDSRTNNSSSLSPSSSDPVQRSLTIDEQPHENPLTQVNSAPNFATTATAAPATAAPARSTDDGAAQQAQNLDNNPTTAAAAARANSDASPDSVSSNPPTDSLQIQPASGETASISSQAASDAAHSMADDNTDNETMPAAAVASAPTVTANANAAVTTTTATTNTTSSSEPPADRREQPAAAMARQRSSSPGDAPSSGAEPGAAAAGGSASPSNAETFLPSIRLSAYYDARSPRPSLSFPPISRTLPSGTETIRVGRYSERDSQATTASPANRPSAAPVGFKSKVVSRRHCEFWYEGGKWYIKDVKSSSGTFLNHIRLSPPSQESKAFPVNDGDIVQLGIDFKGGEEMIFRCVKMRLELNRGWQNQLNSFNVAAHKRLRTMNTGAPGATGSSDCSICLNSIAPCQSLFVAPCSHTWHFKCVRSLLTSPQYPIFICPNCRAGADLEADVDDPAEGWQDMGAEGVEEPDEAPNTVDKRATALPPPVINAPPPGGDDDHSDPDGADLTEATTTVHNTTTTEPPQTVSGTSNANGNPSHATSSPLPIRNSGDRSTSPPGINGEGPITPRNNAGPWVFDGSSCGRSGMAPGMPSMDIVAELDLNQMSSDASSR